MDQVEKTPLFSHSLCMLAKDTLDVCRSGTFTLGTGESLTGGLFGALFTSIPGASSTFAGGIVVYQTGQKHKLLDVSSQTLDEFGPVSYQCAREMAIGVQRRLGVDCAIVSTGVAGPSRDEFDVAVGKVFVAAACKSNLEVFEYSFNPHFGRQGIRIETLSKGLSDSLAFFKHCV